MKHAAYLDCQDWFEKKAKEEGYLDCPEEWVCVRNEFAQRVYDLCEIEEFRQEFFDCVDQFNGKRGCKGCKPLVNPEVWLLEVIKALMPAPIYENQTSSLKTHNGYDETIRGQIESLGTALQGLSGASKVEIEKRLCSEVSYIPWDGLEAAAKDTLTDLYRIESSPKNNKPLSWEEDAFCSILDDFESYFPTVKTTGSPTSFCHAVIALLLKHAQCPFSEKQLRNRISNALKNREKSE